jgi:hypothetical protein
MNYLDILTVFVSQAKGGAQEFGLKPSLMPIQMRAEYVAIKLSLIIKITNNNLR